MVVAGAWLPQAINIFRLAQKGLHVADDILKYSFCNEDPLILIRISLIFVPKGPIDDMPEFIQMMSWHRIGNRPY